MTQSKQDYIAALIAQKAAMDRLVNYTVAQGGGTFDADTLAPVVQSTGYAVAIGSGEATYRDVDDAVHEVWTRFPHAPYIGTFVSNTVIFVDPTVILGGYHDAVILAHALGEDAIYSFAQKEVLDVR